MLRVKRCLIDVIKLGVTEVINVLKAFKCRCNSNGVTVL